MQSKPVAISVKIDGLLHLFLGTVTSDDYAPEVLIERGVELVTANLSQLDLQLWDGRWSSRDLMVRERRIADKGIILVTATYPLRPGLW